MVAVMYKRAFTVQYAQGYGTMALGYVIVSDMIAFSIVLLAKSQARPCGMTDRLKLHPSTIARNNAISA